MPVGGLVVFQRVPHRSYTLPYLRKNILMLFDGFGREFGDRMKCSVSLDLGT
jgi:hypothetical protein